MRSAARPSPKPSSPIRRQPPNAGRCSETTVVIIGAGSVEFTRELLGDILSFPELSSTRVVLHDIDTERLPGFAMSAENPPSPDPAPTVPDDDYLHLGVPQYG
ncbi:hypothetical protein [Mycobacterium sp. ITM-2016-00318]|uniref:family 4 glycosyl hydrolase n=1 Tax=Mycobacterium sp. ITM-2016-00318 TaxID=2099693 RepID=UPI000CF94E00|nr:hypothetical protein [Mycobacterium sp. ITM-2016-00318]WNG93664.1 hypothetical protein C6A82_004125 [Mycobacterium sp. ITM-2016-00318]